jgi:hypothetical protein
MNLSSLIKECQLKNYLFNNECICWDEKQEFYNNCRFYINNTIALEGSPWAKGSAPVSYYKKIGLSVLQKRIIKYLHENFFQYGSPSYLKIETLTNRIGSSRRSTYRAIGRLVDRKILIRLQIFSDKYKHYRSIILPINPLKVKLINKLHSLGIKRSRLDAKRSLPPEVRRDRLLSKLPKSFQKNRQIIDSIYSINILYTNHIISTSKESYKTSFYTQRQKQRCAENTSFNLLQERSKQSMSISRYKLKPIDSKPVTLDRTFVDLVSSVDFDIFNLADDQRRTLLDYVEKHTYDFEFNKMFSEKKLTTRHPVGQRQNRQLLSDYLKLFFSNEPLNHESTNHILRYWNNIDNPKIQKHKIDNPNSIIYTKLLILTNYMLKFYYNNDMTIFLNNLSRIDMYGSQNHYLANTLKKWSLDGLIMLRNTNGIKKYWMTDKKDFEAELFKYRSKNKEAAERWKEIYIHSFYGNNRKLGLEKYNSYHSKLDSFLDLLINRLSECRRELYKRNLTKQMTIDGYETDSILADYCDWISFSIAKRPNIIDLCNYDHFMQFVYQEMRGVRGMEKFWQPIKS